MRRLVVLLALAAVVACGGDSSTSPNSLTGIYTLRTVNGSPVPFTLIQVDANNKYEIVADTLVLNVNGTWTESGTDRSTQDGQVTTGTVTDGGTYTLSGTAITLVSTQFGPTNGSVDNGTLTVTAQGFVGVYKK